MPKKRNQNYNIDTTSRPSQSAPPPKPLRSVNERLAQLRAEQAPKPTIEHRNEIASLATAHSMPPALRQILSLPETAPPTIRSRRQRIINGRRAPPGPAAPESWLATSQHAPAHLRAQGRKGKAAEAMRHIPTRFSRLTTLDDSHPLPVPGSLVDTTLKAMAVSWDNLVEYEQFNLSALPPYLKTSLLSYIGIYGPKEGITSHDLKVLFLDDSMPGSTGSEDISRLDLTGLLSQCFTINDLRKILAKTQSDAEFIRELEGLSLEDEQLPKPPSTAAAQDPVLDSWEEDMDAGAPTLGAVIIGPRFPNLTRLSLANPGASASWHQLLLISPQLSTLTHLSLAYWPTPNETPNASMSFISHRHARIPMGGTNLYSELHEDWQDPANILRRLSNNTYSLRWLDLEGCNEWLPALTWTWNSIRHTDRWADRSFGRLPSTNDAFEELLTSPKVHGPDWNGSWAQLRYVNVSQGVIPCDVASVISRPATVIARELLLWLREKDVRKKNGNPLQYTSQLRKDIHVPDWLGRESQARNLASTVRMLRKSAGGAFCTFDHGWTAPVINVAPKKVEEQEAAG
ncbi:Carboxy-cis/cis-muconate cyclase [Venturia nashicola]|uniref:Carboxy-cis/cis-muconate cyclase n=1 Tax=Venturia nashicola TaxID=86259 RepID=A0A4Z1PCI4_9PEZI|nr:Carboxy-cis/cis-muconate cyclase [Venturia nashicola]TLD39008.1 Carboxy-cis/cis-muconate cyclase [Venturia nashicola]